MSPRDENNGAHQSYHSLIIFDLDQTLVDTICYHKDTDIKTSNYDHIFEHEQVIYKVSVRPKVKEFLKLLLENKYELAIFSKGTKVYVHQIISHIFNDIPWKFIWTHDECYDGTKNLSYVTTLYPQYTHRNMLLIDDSIVNCQKCAQNGYKSINVSEYLIVNKDDDTLFEQNLISKIKFILESDMYIYFV